MRTLEGNSSILVLASHSMTHLETWCNKAVILEKDIISEIYDNVSEAIKAYEQS